MRLTYRIQKYRCVLVKDGVQQLAYDKAPSADMARTVLTRLMRDIAHEEMWALLMDAKMSIIGAVKLSQGGVAAAAVRPSDVFRPVLASGCSCFVLGHNHPSGDPTPSQADVDMTRALIDAGQLLGVMLCDHLIVTRTGAYRSLRDELCFDGMGS